MSSSQKPSANPHRSQTPKNPSKTDIQLSLCTELLRFSSKNGTLGLFDPLREASETSHRPVDKSQILEKNKIFSEEENWEKKENLIFEEKPHKKECKLKNNKFSECKT